MVLGSAAASVCAPANQHVMLHVMCMNVPHAWFVSKVHARFTYIGVECTACIFQLRGKGDVFPVLAATHPKYSHRITDVRANGVIFEG